MTDVRGKHLHFDCMSGVAGDMTLAALFDLGVPQQVVLDAIDAIGVDVQCLRVAPAHKRGIRCLDVKVIPADDASARGHGHDHVHFSEIERRIKGSTLASAVAARAMDMFDRLARAEGVIHGVPPADVALHEVGGLDSIVDIVGTAAALDWLAPSSVSCGEIAMGHGSVECAHGVLPLPAPAALEVLREAGGLICDGGVARELCTPTGAAIVAATVSQWGPMPSLVPLATGYGAGDADLQDRANVLRLVVGRRSAAAASEWLYRVEANVDDMTPEMCAYAAEALVRAGAIDVWWVPVTMKKSRPGLLLGALVPADSLDAAISTTLRETSSIGVRFDVVARRVLDRQLAEVATRFGAVVVKIARLDGEVVNAAPEYESCCAIAEAAGVPVKQVFAAAIAAWEAGASLHGDQE